MAMPAIEHPAQIREQVFGPEVSQRRTASAAFAGSFRNFAALLFLISVPACTPKPSTPAVSQLERVKQSGELRIVTRYGPSTFFKGVNGSAGLEYDLARLFAKRLGVRAKFSIPGTVSEVKRLVASGQADIAAAGLIANDRHQTGLRFAPPYRRISPQILYGEDHRRPESLEDLADGVIEVVAGSGHVATLREISHRQPGLNWRARYEHDASALMFFASEGLIDYTIADSDHALILRRYYPKLRVAFDVGQSKELAWALPMAEDESLYHEVVRFFGQIKADGTLDQLIDRYYGHAEAFDAALDSSLRRDFEEKLPAFRRMFERAGESNGVDWRLLAAIAYQESKWKSDAISKEGVRGMMMLTGVTARELKVRDRFNAAQSIAGGAFYYKQTLDALPPEIPSPDRMWFALAAYNMGPGHVEDARELVRNSGGDPNKWIEIKKFMPLLGKGDWYRKTKYGRARGGVAVHYVNSIRRYYDLLVWLTEQESGRRLAADFAGSYEDGA